MRFSNYKSARALARLPLRVNVPKQMQKRVENLH